MLILTFNDSEEKAVEKVIAALADKIEFEVMEYGVMSMPALVVNEKVVSMGKVLKSADIETLLHKLGF